MTTDSTITPERRMENEKFEGLLTNREFEISVLVAEGLSNKHIARRVGISEGRLKIHLCNTYRKLGGMNRASLTSVVDRYRGGQPAAWTPQVRPCSMPS